MVRIVACESDYDEANKVEKSCTMLKKMMLFKLYVKMIGFVITDNQIKEPLLVCVKCTELF